MDLIVKKIYLPDHSFLELWKLNRAKYAHSLSPNLLNLLNQNLERAKVESPRLIVLGSTGSHFCAGADLEWMKSSKNLNRLENIEDARKLYNFFQNWVTAQTPLISVIKGACYGGGVGIAAGSHVVIADLTAKFSLSELKLGLVPSVIYPALRRRLSLAKVRLWSMTSKIYTAPELMSLGFVDHVVNSKKELFDKLLHEVNAILQVGPVAVKQLSELIAEDPYKEEKNEFTLNKIAEVRASAEAFEGMSAFFTKTKPSWAVTVNETDLKWILDDEN